MVIIMVGKNRDAQFKKTITKNPMMLEYLPQREAKGKMDQQ